MRKFILGIIAVAPLFVVAPASAQQIVDTSTGVKHAGGQCSVSQAMLAAIEQDEVDRLVDTKTRINALLDNALARSQSRPQRQAGQSPVVFPPARSGS